MDTGGGKCNHNVTFCHAGVVKNLLLVNDTNSKACEVVIIFRHESRMFCGFAADECRAGLDTALSHTADDGSDLFGDVLAACDIVKEEQRTSTAADDIVDAHSNGIDTDGVMLVHQDCHLDLGAASVGTGDENRFLHTGNRQTETAAKTADIV